MQLLSKINYLHKVNVKQSLNGLCRNSTDDAWVW